jgi:hypothetical protein
LNQLCEAARAPLERPAVCGDNAGDAAGHVRAARPREKISPASRVGLSVLATGALIWLVGLTAILVGMLLFWAVLSVLLLVYWRRKAGVVRVAAIPLRPIGAPGPTPV